ncbi:hypothetical protein [Microcella sp.]|uniref:hypothetical protein n=1 Tax=Microcella sp. TaxID=1913979 RepID=UPI0039196C95
MNLARSTTAIAAAIVLATALAGCVGAPVDPGASASPSPSASPDAAPSPTASSSVGPTGLVVLPFSIACDELVTADALYEFNPNVGVDPEPSATGLVATIAESGGVTCGWLNQTSGDRISVGVLRLDAASLDRVRGEAAERGEPETQYFDGYFREEGGVGHAEDFERDYWIVLDSAALLGADEVGSFLAALRPALP